MGKKILLAAIVLAIIAAGAYWFFVKKETAKTDISPNSSPSGQSNIPLSETPNASKFNEYFKGLYLGKIPAGSQMGIDATPEMTFSFGSSDQFCTIAEPAKIIPAGAYSSAIYNVNSKNYAKQKTVLPVKLEMGTTGGCGDLPAGPGKYEYKAYINNTLVMVLPFEIN